MQTMTEAAFENPSFCYPLSALYMTCIYIQLDLLAEWIGLLLYALLTISNYCLAVCGGILLSCRATAGLLCIAMSRMMFEIAKTIFVLLS